MKKEKSTEEENSTEADITSLCSEILQSAENGALAGVGFAAVGKDGSVASGFVAECNYATLVGACETLKYRIHEKSIPKD